MIETLIPHGVRPHMPAGRAPATGPSPESRSAKGVVPIGLVLSGLLLLVRVGPLAAQSQGTLQVAAVVVSSQPSRLALIAAMGQTPQPTAVAAPRLATVQIAPAKPAGAIGPAIRSLVTISFVYN